MKRRDAANAELEVIERRFFESIIPFLTDDQIGALDRVFMMRVRERVLELRLLFPGSEIDLTD